jgi:hypothetical protein
MLQHELDRPACPPVAEGNAASAKIGARGTQAGVRAASQETLSFSQTAPSADEPVLNILLDQCARLQIPQRATPEMAANWPPG